MDEATHKKKFKPIVLRDVFINDPILYHHGYKKDVDFLRASNEAFNLSLEVRGRIQPVKAHVDEPAEDPEKGFSYIKVKSFPSWK